MDIRKTRSVLFALDGRSLSATIQLGPFSGDGIQCEDIWKALSRALYRKATKTEEATKAEELSKRFRLLHNTKDVVFNLKLQSGLTGPLFFRVVPRGGLVGGKGGFGAELRRNAKTGKFR